MSLLQTFPRGGGGGGTAGVTSFNNRTGVVTPQAGDYSKGDVGLGNVDNTADVDKPISTATQTALNGKIASTEKGTANGVATLDSNGKIPSSQLPSYVDDVVEGYYNSTTDRFYEENTFITVITPVEGKSWVDISSNKSYRWTGSVYVRVDEGVQLGETSNSAYRGDRGKAAYDHSKLTSGNPHNVTKSDIGLGNVNNTSDANKPISNATQTALNAKADDSNVVHKTGDESIAGTKTFTGNVVCNNPLTVAGADYAEKFKTTEKIPLYRFVTLDGEEIKLAQRDEYIVGVTSENPGIIGNVLLEEGINVGLIGKLWVEQDGTAKVNGYVTVGRDGIATKSQFYDDYRVMTIDGNKCKILFR